MAEWAKGPRLGSSAGHRGSVYKLLQGEWGAPNGWNWGRKEVRRKRMGNA